jgi:hypothetical protein
VANETKRKMAYPTTGFQKAAPGVEDMAIQQLVFRKRHQELRIWLREVKTLSDAEEVGHICEP